MSESQQPEENQNGKHPRDEEAPQEPNKIAKVEEESEEEEEPEPRHFIHWRWLTVPILRECVTWSEPKNIKGKCTVVWMNFNFEKFRKLCPDHPPILSKQRKLFFSTPFLKTSFGYSPYMGPNGVVNNLRLVFDEFLDQESADFYERCKEWDEWFIDVIFEHKNKWPLKIKLDEGEELKRSDVAKKYRPICRDQEKDGVIQPDRPKYMSVKFVSPRDDPKKKIKGDPYTAFVTVWNNQKELVAEKLTIENAVPSEEEIKEDPGIEEKRKVYIGKNSYVEVIEQLQKIYFTSDFGPTIIADELLYDTEENLKSKKESKKACPFSG